MVILLTNRTMAGRKKTNIKRRIFLFIVIEFLTNSAAMFVMEGKTMLEMGLLFSVFLISFTLRLSDSFWLMLMLCRDGVFELRQSNSSAPWLK